MQAIVIPLKVTGIGQAQRQIQQLGQQLAGLSRGGNVGGFGGGGGRMNQASRLGLPANWNPRMPGSRPPPIPQSFGQRAMSALMTSRFGAGGIMPLVGKVAGLLGPLGSVAAVATEAMKKFAEMTVEAAKNLQEFGQAGITGGGTALETAIGKLIGDMTGGKAREFSDRISSDPFAAGAASRAGIYDPGGALFGPIDKAKMYRAWDRYLRSKPLETAIREARRTGTEDLIQNRYFNRATDKTIAAVGAATAAIMTPDKVQAAINFNKQLDLMKQNMENLGAALTSDFMKAMNLILPTVNAATVGLTKFINSPFFKFMTGFGAMFGGAGKLYDFLNPAKDDKESAQKSNTEAIKELTATIKQGVYGGGERARGAVPKAWMGAADQQWYRQAASLGAFSL